MDSRNRSPNPLGVGSPRLRAAEGGGASPKLAPISEPKHDLAHEVARRALQDRKRYRRSKLRVDAFLGEWLNPQYFEDITPPPPSSMMVRTAKAELMQNETVEVFTPMATSSGKSSGANSLWSGGAKVQSLDEWSQIQDSLPHAPAAVREGRSRASTVGSDTSPVESGRKSPFRPGSALSPLTSTMPKPELSVYSPPTPQYAVSSSDQIPRGYFAHAKNACTNVDFQWDSSRSSQNWGDGGELGEEWSAMHKRFRKGLNNLIQWYSQHDADDRGEDALGFEQAERGADGCGEEEEEELVVVLVTHGAGCNALIGALTGQPVLLDVGMASLTMAVRKGDAPPPTILTNGASPTQSRDPTSAPRPRRSSTDTGLSALYDMSLVASSEHLRPASSTPSFRRNDLASVRDSLAQYKRLNSTSSTDSQPLSDASGPPRSNTSALLGSIRRPSAAPLSAPGSTLPSRMNSSFPEASPPVSAGLWTPPAGRTPVLRAQEQPKSGSLAPLGGGGGGGEGARKEVSEGGDSMVLDFSTSPPDSRPGTSSGKRAEPQSQSELSASSLNGALEEAALITETDELPELPGPAKAGKRPDGDLVERAKAQGNGKGMVGPKRRWTVDERD